MSQSGLSLTNQRLYFTRLQLDLLADLPESLAQPARAAQYESVVFHLLMSYRALLAELLDLDVSAISGLTFSANSFVDEDAEIIQPELRELILLEADKTSWLACMLNEARKLGGAAERVTDAIQQSEISVAMITESVAGADKMAQLVSWHESLKSMAQQLRALSQEW